MNVRFFLCFVFMLFLQEPALLCQERVVNNSEEKTITVQEYCIFLNTVAAKDPYYLYEGIGWRLGTKDCNQIIRLGEPGNYRYEVASSQPNTPMLLMSKLNAEQYCNWLKNTPSTLTINFNSYEVAHVDPLLKSNLLIFHLVNTEAHAYQTGIAEIAAADGADEAFRDVACTLAWIVSMVEGGGGRPEVQAPHLTSRDLHQRTALERTSVLRQSTSEVFTNEITTPLRRSASLGFLQDDAFPLTLKRRSTFSTVEGFKQRSTARAAQAPPLIERVTLQSQEALLERVLKMMGEKVSALEAFTAMACFRTCDFEDLSEEAAALWGGLNQGGGNLLARHFILNKSEPSVPLILPATGSQVSAITIVPPIIPTGVTIRVSTETYTSPSRVPTAQENRAIRALRRKSFEFYYGPEKAQELLFEFDGPEKQDDPVTVGEMYSILQKTYVTDPFSQENHRLLITEESKKAENDFRKHSRIREVIDVVNNVSVNITNFRNSQIQFQKQQEMASKVNDALVNPEKYLLQGLYYTAESIPPAVRNSIIIPAICGAADGAAFSTKYGFFYGSYIGGVISCFITNDVLSLLPVIVMKQACLTSLFIWMGNLFSPRVKNFFFPIRMPQDGLTYSNIVGYGSIAVRLAMFNSIPVGLLALVHSVPIATALTGSAIIAVTTIAGTFLGAGLVGVSAAVAGATLGGILGATRGVYQGVISGSNSGLEDHLMETPAQKAQEAFSYWSGTKSNEVLELMKNAQETDQQRINTIDDFLESSAHIEELFLEQSTHEGGSTIESEAQVSSGEEESRSKMSLREIKKILSRYIQTRIAERQVLIDDLQ